MSNWLSLSKEEQVNLFNQVSDETGLRTYAIEKDAWVTLVLRMLFSSELSPYIVFKGGTSLSKVYGLIQRFSEDVDMSIQFPEAEFTEKPFPVKTIIPEKTFLEKMILLHEEFQKPEEKIRSFRISRHLYDIHQIMNTEYGQRALKDEGLFRAICEHRKVFTPVKPVNYDRLSFAELKFIPPDEVMFARYKDDYDGMKEDMIYGEKLGFEEMVEELGSLKIKL